VCTRDLFHKLNKEVTQNESRLCQENDRLIIVYCDCSLPSYRIGYCAISDYQTFDL